MNMRNRVYLKVGFAGERFVTGRRADLDFLIGVTLRDATLAAVDLVGVVLVGVVLGSVARGRSVALSTGPFETSSFGISFSFRTRARRL